MLIGTTERLLQCGNLDIDFKGVQITFVKEATLLGIYIDDTFSWDAPVEFVTKKVIGKLAVLKSVSYFMPSNALLKVYNSIDFPHFTYCCTVWSKVKNQFYLEKVSKLQTRAERILLNN
jgi:hypothetical protein